MVKKVDSKGRSNTRKRGSKEKVQCQLCGKVVTKAGFVGHMHWKHGKDFKAPLLDKEKPMPYQTAKRKAADLDKFLRVLTTDLMAKYHASPAYLTEKASLLVSLHDRGLSPEHLTPYVQDAVDQIKRTRDISFDEAKELLQEAIHNIRTS